MRNVKLSDEELYKLKDEVVSNIEEYVDFDMALRIFDGIEDAVKDKKTETIETRKCVVSLAYAVSVFISMCKPKNAEHIDNVAMGEMFYDHLDVFCSLLDIIEEDEKEKAN